MTETSITIYVDADACPVKREVNRVADRYDLPVILVANSWMRVPNDQRAKLQLVPGGENVADDWIVENVEPRDIVVTADVPLAKRCIDKRALVLKPNGKTFTEDNIGDILATRDLLTDLRSAGEVTGGPKPFDKRDRSLFLQELDKLIHSSRKTKSRLKQTGRD